MLTGIFGSVLIGASPVSADTYTCASGPASQIFDNSNIQGVFNGGVEPTFNTNGTYCLTEIVTYHWNNGSGASPGFLGLSGASTVGPVQASASSGQGGAPNVNWYVNFSTTSPIVINGTYNCTDSDHSTWSQNAASGGFGFCHVWGVPATLVSPPPPPPPPPPPAPTVTQVSPSLGPVSGGTAVTIYGSGFSTAPGGTAFTFGLGNPATSVACASSGSCTAVTPPGSGTVDVQATVGGQTSAVNAPADQFQYVPPTVWGVSPNVGPVAGGTQVTISGSGFSTTPGATSFSFGSAGPATLVSCSSSISCTAVTPSGALGSIDVVATVGGVVSPVNAPSDQFAYAAPPTVTSLSPSSGPLAGGTTVTITGTSFSTTGDITFLFGGIATATNVFCSFSTTCTATSPSGIADFPLVDVTVVVGHRGGFVSSANPPGDQFTYFQTTATTLTASPDPVNANQPVVYTATVKPAPNSGTVGFTSDGTTIPGCGNVAVSTATATCTQTFTVTGSHNIQAIFTPGNPYFKPSTSAFLTEAVVNCGATLQGCNLSGANLTGVNLSGANLANANLKGTNLSQANLSGANLVGANLKGALLSGATLDGANLTGENLSGISMLNASVEGAILTGANLSGATLTGTNFSYSQLQNANLTGVSADGTKFVFARLDGANLSGSSFKGADFSYAVLTNANLSKDDFTGATFQVAYAVGATANKSNFTNANLLALNAGFAGSAGFTFDTWSNTTCPDSTNSNLDGGTCVNNFL